MSPGSPLQPAPAGRGTSRREEDHDLICLTLPARAELLILPRLVVAAVGARANFDLDAIEDLRLAIDELCVSVIGEGEEEGELSLELALLSDGVQVSCTFRPAGGQAPSSRVPELSLRILDALVDEHAYAENGESRTATMRKSSAGRRPAS